MLQPWILDFIINVLWFEDDANDDPQWSEEQIVEHRFELNGLKIGKHEVNLMKRQTDLIFRVLEKAWSTEGCALIDLKVEFGVTKNGTQFNVQKCCSKCLNQLPYWNVILV